MPHIHEKIDFTVEVFVVHKNKVLLRKHDKLGIWLSVGGHIELDEDPNQAAVREVKEEVGLDIILFQTRYTPVFREEGYTELIPPVFLDKQNQPGGHEHVTLVYFASSVTDVIRQPETHEKSECLWLTKEELRKRGDVRESIKYYASTALEYLI